RPPADSPALASPQASPDQIFQRDRSDARLGELALFPKGRDINQRNPTNESMNPLSLPEFVKRWQDSTLKERSGSQSHVIALCQVLGKPTPTSIDQTGDRYTFEKGVTKIGGDHGFADVWLRGHFAWEYKGKQKNLTAAYEQLA